MPLGVAIGFCDLFYALMAFPTMITLLLLGGKVREEIRKIHRPSRIITLKPSPHNHIFAVKKSLQTHIHIHTVMKRTEKTESERIAKLL